MTITIEQVQAWLRTNATILRAGGAPETAEVWEEIAELLGNEREKVEEAK